MPVISPRRSTSSTSGSLYIPQTTSGTYSSSLANKSTTGSSALSSSSSSSTSGYSSTYRSNGYTKTPSSTYTSSSSYLGSYLPRGTYPSVSRSTYSSSSSSALTGGSSALSSSYRASSYLSGGNNDTTTSSSRFGRDLDHKRSTDNTDCNQNNNNSHTKSHQRSSSTSRNPRSSSSSYPSSSLARLVATSALEIYEKYSPSNYIPKCELSRSSSLSEGAASAATANAATTSSSSPSSTSLIRNNDSKITHSNSISRISNNNNNNNYSRRYNCRQTNGTINENSEARDSAPAYSSSSSSITDTYLSVPQHSSSNGGSSSAANKLLLHVSYDLPDDSNSLRDLKISCISPTTTTTSSSTTASSSSSQDTKDTAQLATKQKRSVEAKTTTTSSNTTNKTTTTSAATKATTTTTISNNTTSTSNNPNNQSTTTTTTTTSSAKAGNQQFFLISAFKDQNFLKKECELARSQVSRSRQQRFDNNNGIDDDNTNNNNGNNNNNNNTDDSQYDNNNENGGSPLAGKASSIVTYIHDNHKLQGVSSAAIAKNQSSIKPLIHRAPNSINSRFLSSSSRLATNNNNNNMHCLHSNSELLDDIKYIDSDDTERQQHQQQQQQQQQQHQHQHQQRQHKPKLRPKSSIISSSNQSLLFEKVNPYKYQNGTLLSSSPPVSSSAPTSTTSTATSSPSSTLPLMGGRRCDTSSIKASIEKFNTLAEAKRLPTRCSTTNLQLSNDYDRRVPLRERSASPATSSSHSTATTRGSSITSNLAASNSTSSGSIASNNLILRNRSTESSPSHSPKNLRKTSITQFTGGLHNGSTSSLVKNNATYEKITLTTVSMLSCPTPTLSTVTSRTISIDKKIPSAAPSASSSSSSPSNKNSDIDESVRSTSSLRSTLPPLPPNPTRDWDRDSSRSSILSSRNLSDDYSSSSSRKLSPEQEGLCGLRNIGNTCFMNSVIQCLSHTSELTKFLKTQNGVRSSSSKDQQILSEFAKLIKEMWTSNVNSVTPSELKRAFSSKHRMYSDYNQQDAQEFLRFFLDSLHSALNSGVKGDLLKIDESLSDNRKADITWEWYAKAENSVIRDLFVGQLKSTLKCTVCGNTSVTFDPVWDLSVPLPSSSRCKIEACLDLFIREEVLDGDEMPTCSKCQTRRKSTKSFTIQRFPKYLVIHLKRFSETRWSKMSNIVEFPTGERELNMGPYGSNSSTNVYYSLYAISNHMGSTAGGHYVALCKHPITKKWHEFNDNVVSSELTESHLVSSSAYILFYERAHRRLNEEHVIINTAANATASDQAINFLSQRKNQNFKRKQQHPEQAFVVVAFPSESNFFAPNQKSNAIDSRNTNDDDVVRFKTKASYNHHNLHQQEPIFLINVLLGIMFYAILFTTCYYFFF